MKHLIYSLIIVLLFTACSSTPPPYQPSSSKQSPALKKLYAQYNNWRGTPYKYGGLSLSGVDCSGFVFQAYRSAFNISLPRSTKDQVRKGKRVYINALRTGDLIFFKTGYKVYHVGIYTEKGRFMHASTSKGVIISSVQKGYWRKHYWQARRLI